MTRTAPPTPARGDRLLDVDRLRIGAIAAIIVYHTARLFDVMEPWHVKSGQRLEWLTYPMAAGSQVVMPLFWVLSGISTRYALGSRPAGAFARRRLERLGVPVVALGWFVLSPPQVYIEATTGQGYHAPPFVGSFPEFLPRYVSEGLYGWGGYFAWTALHLWYLVYLLLFSLASLPLFVWMRGRGARTTAVVTSFLARPGAVHLLGLGVVATEVFAPRTVPVLGWEEGGWLLGSFWVFLLVGYLIGTDLRLRGRLEHERWFSLVLALATFVPLAILAPGITSLAFGSPAFIAEMTLRTVNGWFCVAAVLGFGTHHLCRPATPALAYLGEAVLPVFVLHQPVIVLLGYLVRDWPVPGTVMLPLLLAVVLAVCLGIHEVLIRRHRFLRVLFGMDAGVRRSRSDG